MCWLGPQKRASSEHWSGKGAAVLIPSGFSPTLILGCSCVVAGRARGPQVRPSSVPGITVDVVNGRCAFTFAMRFDLAGRLLG